MQRRALAGQKGVYLVQKVQLSNKVKALERLAEFFGLLHESPHGRDDAALLARLDEGRKRVATEDLSVHHDQ